MAVAQDRQMPDETNEAITPEEGDEEAEEAKDGKKEKKEKGKTKRIVKNEKMGRLNHEELDWIWIGDAEDARDATELRKNNIRYILNCTMPRGDGGVSNFHERDNKFEYCRLALADNATENLQARFEAAWEFLEKVRIREDGSVLVHCQQGVSRSVSMVLSYLMKYYRFSFEVARAMAKEVRAQANPNEGFEKQLRELEERLIKTNGYEKVPPPRKRAAPGGMAGGPTKKAAVGPARGPAGPARGPAGPPRGPVGPAVGPAVGPSIGPAMGPPVGPQVGPSIGPSVGPAPAPGPAVGPAGPPTVGPAPPPGPTVGPAVGPALPAGPMVGPMVGPAGPPTVGPAPPPKKEKKSKVAVGPARPPGC